MLVRLVAVLHFIFTSQMGTALKARGCQKDLLLAVTPKKKNLHVKYLIRCIWQGMLPPSGSIFNKMEACEL